MELWILGRCATKCNVFATLSGAAHCYSPPGWVKMGYNDCKKSLQIEFPVILGVLSHSSLAGIPRVAILIIYVRMRDLFSMIFGGHHF